MIRIGPGNRFRQGEPEESRRVGSQGQPSEPSPLRTPFHSSVGPPFPMTTPTRWQPSDYRVELPTTSLTRTLVEAIHRLVCRTTFDQPGFCLVDLGRPTSSLRQRALMVELMRAMAEIERTTTGRRLAYQSATRFDQQGTTKLHRDGGPEECFLMLGYEPTTVPSEVALADSARCAADLGITETEFLEQHNPMFHEGEELLRPYLTRLDAFDWTAFQILLINNSLTLSHHDGRPAWKGVLHTATILAPDPSASRVINSSLIVSLPEGAPEPFSEDDLEEFLTTDTVLRRGYPV